MNENALLYLYEMNCMRNIDAKNVEEKTITNCSHLSIYEIFKKKKKIITILKIHLAKTSFKSFINILE